jgi:hypothetical protein
LLLQVHFCPGFSHQRVDAMKPSIKGHVTDIE